MTQAERDAWELVKQEQAKARDGAKYGEFEEFMCLHIGKLAGAGTISEKTHDTMIRRIRLYHPDDLDDTYEDHPNWANPGAWTFIGEDDKGGLSYNATRKIQWIDEQLKAG